MIEIQSNGSKWAGDPPDQLGKLLDMLEQHPLDAFWAHGDACCHLAHGSEYGGRDANGPIYLDTGPLYPEHPYAVQFFGNFLTYSHGFSIITDDADVIEVLHAAIAANMQRPDYQAQRVAA